MGEPTARQRGILVVDDDETIRGLLADALTEAGYAVRTANDGRAALAILDDWRPDLIVLDLLMPGMDGWAFRAEQRRRPAVRDIPVIVQSARRDVRAEAERLGAAAVFGNPFDLKALVAKVEQLMS